MTLTLLSNSIWMSSKALKFLTERDVSFTLQFSRRIPYGSWQRFLALKGLEIMGIAQDEEYTCSGLVSSKNRRSLGAVNPSFPAFPPSPLQAQQIDIPSH
jgi:hypothetical protein